MDNTVLDNILQHLEALGEDKDELQYWRDIYDDLPQEKQQEVYRLFEDELAKLQK